MLAFECHDTQFESNPFSDAQPVKISQQRCDVLCRLRIAHKPRCRVDESHDDGDGGDLVDARNQLFQGRVLSVASNVMTVVLGHAINKLVC